MSEENKLQGCAITGVGSYVPERILANAELESMVNTTDDWITSRTGIKQRRIAAVLGALDDKIELNRKMLSEMAIHDPNAFDAIVEQVKESLAV
mgnify:CR=1 FL=1